MARFKIIEEPEEETKPKFKVISEGEESPKFNVIEEPSNVEAADIMKETARQVLPFGMGKMMFPTEQEQEQMGAAKKFFIDEPARGAGVLREELASKMAPSREEIFQQAAETGKPPLGPIIGRTVAETISEAIPMTPTDFVLLGAIGAGGMGVGALGSRLAATSPMARFAGRAIKTPISQIGGRIGAARRFGALRGGQPRTPGITQPGVPTAPVRPRPLVRPGEAKPPSQGIVQPGEQPTFGPIIKEPHLRPSVTKNIVGPADPTKPRALYLKDIAKLDKPPANTVEPIIQVEGPVVLAEQEIKDGVGAVIQREFIDKFTPIKGIPTKGISPEFEQAGGGYSKAYVMSRLLKGKVRGKSELLFDKLNTIVEPLKNASDRTLLNEIYTMRNFRDLDMMGRRTSGITMRDANKKLMDIKERIGEAKFDRISKVSDDIADLQNNESLDLLVDANVITRETATELKKRFPNYLRSEVLDENLVPRYPEVMAAGGEQMGRINRGFLKTKKGTTKLINTDVLDVVRRSILSKVALAEKQKVVDQIAKEFGVPVGKRIFGSPKETKVLAGFNIRAGQTSKPTIDQKMIVETFDQKQIPQGWVRSTLKPSNHKIVAVRKEVEELMQGLNTQEADMITSMMSHYNNFFRLGATTYRLPFVIGNIARDMQALLFNKRVLPNQKTIPVAAVEGAMSAIKAGFGVKDKLFKEFLDSGAAFGGVITERAATTRLPFRLRPKKEQIKDSIKSVVALPFEEIGRLAQISENTTRLAELARIKNVNMPRELKALSARDISVDFEKMGNSMKLMNRWVPFLNAQVQGELNTGRAIQAQPLVSVGRIGYLAMMPAVSLYAWNRQFKNDKFIDPYIKDNYFYVNTGIDIEREGKKVPVLITARKGEAAKWITRPLELFMAYAEDDPTFQAQMNEYDAENMGAALLSRVIPPAMGAVGEQVSNFDLFRRRPIVPQRLQDVEPGSQFTTFTSNTARLLGEKTGVSPVRMEHLARSVFPASPQIVEGIDIALKTLGVEPEVPRKEREALRRAEAFVPIARAPSGFFSHEKEEASEFLEETRMEERTPRFMFEESFKQYMDEQSPENYDRVIKFAGKISGADRKRIMDKVRKQIRLKAFTPREEAVRRLPKRLQIKFRQRLQERGL